MTFVYSVKDEPFVLRALSLSLLSGCLHVGDWRCPWFEHFSHSLYEERWDCVHDFIEKSDPLIRVLKELWNENAFVHGMLGAPKKPPLSNVYLPLHICRHV